MVFALSIYYLPLITGNLSLIYTLVTIMCIMAIWLGDPLPNMFHMHLMTSCPFGHYHTESVTDTKLHIMKYSKS